MIESTSFLGMPLRTQHQRRLVVAAYYALLMAIVAFSAWQGERFWAPLSALTIMLGGLLGGIKIGGPVKPYGKVSQPLALQSLNLAGRRPFGLQEPLDERERLQRDHAHFTAYRLLYATLAVLALFYTAGRDIAPQFITHVTPLLLWAFLVYMLSLPQSVVLWTEPDHPGELAEVRSTGS